MGGEPNTKSVARLPLAKGYKRKKVERLGLIPVLVNAYNKVEAVEFHGSAHIFALSKAEGYIMIPLGESEIKEGEFVDVRPL